MPLTVRGLGAPDAADVHEHRIDGLVLRARTLRHSTAAPPDDARADTVLVHGLGSSSATFAPLARHLMRAGTVHLLDLPGFARLPRPRHRLEVEELASVVVGWIERAGLERPVLVGHSMGAQVVTEMAAAAPESASGVVLLGPTTDLEGRSAARQMLRLARSTAHESNAARAVLMRAYAECGPRWYLSELRAMLGHRVEERVGDVRAPVLVVRGDHDRVAPARWTALLADTAPHGRAATVPGAGHAVMYDRAREVADLVLEHAVP
ncbi:alpha/beta fold hydrolase [Cellulomonas dongxiuzhuiae]|uniref:Alpha/beta hydrolase n=1 Tax=Cellulomonas dongxiuzhuiae TaxID=2819979 RepID=A0ABX8GLZ2_9CELL|nr:alpha/beta fold hydrolase [Cellulomonas dongxiuzhuiae]MBO3095906.1 alpha/beta fold hydrolase [Cellulomonas dongxiuzhuiae]QWC17204.1 alpha/beta hydrolase [Cellulomonas dongxiuzhuiae]